MSMSAFSLALNSYFTTRRNRAMGLAITITALGPILMPQIASFLLTFYGTQVYIKNCLIVSKKIYNRSKKSNIFSYIYNNYATYKGKSVHN